MPTTVYPPPYVELLKEMIEQWKTTNDHLEQIVHEMRRGPRPLGPGQ